MEEAALTTYGIFRAIRSHWAEQAEIAARDGVMPETTYFANAIAIGIPIYGKHSSSDIWERISQKDLKKGHFLNNCATFYPAGENLPHYGDIRVKKRDLRMQIARMKNPMYSRK